MGSFIGSVILNVSEEPRALEFWKGALGYVAQANNPAFLVPPEWAPPSRTRHDHMVAFICTLTAQTGCISTCG
jgi:hypothetical protein